MAGTPGRGPRTCSLSHTGERSERRRALEVELPAEVDAVDEQVAARIAAVADIPPVLELVAEAEPRPALVARRRVRQADVEREGRHRLRAVKAAGRAEDFSPAEIERTGE